ncbi:ribosomal protein S16 [Dacryopinax primogenitus]|uniref:Ribosomal protein S16 n=1 Tax=Dacryopinax primogenitus (strain DJM 731) TaxID=1858805 RepID=M5G715_DACPD|nr:ribosomal protein S16 [Dacryopinax primogenitus]EJU04000.1 ribosomal protein S16 [Dacryopinax primogenitus]
MPVRLRLAMHGTRNSRIFHIVAAHASKARNAKPIETLGMYDPRSNPLTKEKTVEWSVERIRYWLGVGAQPSDTVLALLERGGIVPAAPRPWNPTSDYAPTPSFPCPSPARLEALDAANSTSPSSQKKSISPREQQLHLTRQWTHNMKVLNFGAVGGIPEVTEAEVELAKENERERAELKESRRVKDGLERPPPNQEQLAV